MAKEQDWMAEHMLILGLTSPSGEKRYFTAAFPSACGKTNLAMLTPTLPGWKVECLGDDIAWMRPGKDGRLYAINPEAGFFGVAPGTSFQSNPNAMYSMERNTIFTNVGLTPDNDVWWEGMSNEPPHLINWLGHPWTPHSEEKAAHPNARFTCPAKQCPVIDPAFDDPLGVPISGIIFGGRRPSVVPLVYESLNWQHGTFLGASVSSETTAAAEGEVGQLRHDPFAMLPFCGYNMGDYFSHWLKMGKLLGSQAPKIFYVNWFRTDPEGRFLWPGFGENCRVLEWMFERCRGTGKAIETPIGYLPAKGALNLSGLSLSSQDLDQLFAIDTQAWLAEADKIEEYLKLFGDHLPPEFPQELEMLRSRLKKT
jgi:phosphoenolpyruvate carboxykinase (GTP)